MLEDKPKTSLPAEGVVSAPRRRHYSNVYLLVVFLAFALFVGTSFRSAVVDGISMLPTFKNGQRLTISNAYWLVGGIRDGDVVVIRDSNKTGYIIKRVYKTGGQIVDLGNTPKDWSLANGLFKVPANDIYVLGDNYEKSEDSRVFGPVALTKVIGKVVIKP